MPNTYNLFLSDGTLAFQIDEGTVVNRHGLQFTGFQKPAYGEARSNNLIRLAENFASEEDAGNPGNPPTSAIDIPLTGQFWYDKTADTLKVYNGTAWVPVSTDVSTNNGPIDVDNGATSIATARVVLPQTTGGNIIITNITSYQDFTDHLADPLNAHAASAIFFNDTGDIPGDDVQQAILDVQANLDAHITDPTAAHAASAISTVATGSITSTNTQAAIQELEDELNVEQAQVTATANTLAAHIADAVDAHDASAISYDNTTSGLPAAFDVQAAIIELNNAVGGTANQSVIDSLRVVRSGVQNFSASTWTKVQFNSVQFGDDLNQFNTINNRYTAGFDQTVRVRLSVSINTVNDENFMLVSVWKNGVEERTVEEWKWPEDSDPPGDRELSVIVDLDAGEYIEGYVWRNGGGGTISIDTLTTRTAMEIDVIKAQGAVPVPGPVSLSDHDIETSTIDGFTATATFTMGSNGDATSVGVTTPGFVGNEWHNTNPNPGIGNDFQVRATLTGGVAPSSGTLNTWQTMNVNRSWTNNQTVVGSRNSELFIEIRDVATLTLQETAFIDVRAVVTALGK